MSNLRTLCDKLAGRAAIVSLYLSPWIAARVGLVGPLVA
jgi:hypothetical protein